MLATSPQWISIMIGASRAESTSSNPKLNGRSKIPLVRQRLRAPDEAGEAGETKESKKARIPRALGIPRSARLMRKVRKARTGSMCGHTGKSVMLRVKYSGRANSFWTPSASAARMKSNHSGEERKVKIPVRR